MHTQYSQFGFKVKTLHSQPPVIPWAGPLGPFLYILITEGGKIPLGHVYALVPEQVLHTHQVHTVA